MFDRLRRPSQSEGPQLALDMEPLSLQSHMRTHLHYYQEGQGKPLTAPFTSEKSEVEILSEDRLYARRKRRHEEAMGTHNDAAKTEDLFNQKVDEASMKWTDGVHPPSTDSKAYVKLVSPSGKLTKEVAKDLLQRLKIPVKTEMGVLMQHMYKHYFYGAETTVPKIDKKEAANKAIFTTPREVNPVFMSDLKGIGALTTPKCIMPLAPNREEGGTLLLEFFTELGPIQVQSYSRSVSLIFGG